VKTVSNTTFKDLGLSATLLATLEKEGYTSPTPVQALAIPDLLKGHDLLGIAQTGTGKTAAFALPILHHILAARTLPAPKGVRALILSPTRELATQIADSFKSYGRGLGLQIATIFGGVKYGPQYKALQGGLDILVATPGRLIDHIEQKTINLSGVEFFVLDEADQMLDMGFVKPIRQVVSRLKAERQNLFFSATMPKEIAGLAAELLKNPKRVEITPESTTAEKVSQRVIFVEALRKRAMLSELYADDNLSRTLVFTRTKRSADRVAAYLQAGGVECAAIHGDKNQSQRERALQAFKAGKLRALVATDIAARGIDVDGVTHVINYELPFVSEAYVHRIGRTARAGKTGESITLVADDERKLIKAIERMIRQTIPSFDRRKDNGLKLLDEAILASGQTEKPKTPDRIKEARHSDPDAERVHKRSRNRPERSENRGRPGKAPFERGGERGPRHERTERYDPMAAEKAPMGALSESGARTFKSKPPRDDRPSRDDRAPRADRFEGRGDRPAHVRDAHAPREDRPHREPRGEARPAADARNDGRPAKAPFKHRPKSNDGKFGGAKSGTNKFKKPNIEGGDRGKPSEGAQFKRRAKA
jgi:ATP-dependent RNA helicase RhlE